jgi:hypothetical protein
VNPIGAGRKTETPAEFVEQAVGLKYSASICGVMNGISPGGESGAIGVCAMDSPKKSVREEASAASVPGVVEACGDAFVPAPVGSITDFVSSAFATCPVDLMGGKANELSAAASNRSGVGPVTGK